MALPVCQFVDRVGTGAQQRLNLNDGKNFSLMQGPDVRPGPDFSPPKLKRAVVNTLLVDGASIPASAYDNRIIRLPLRVKACDEDEMAEKLETLHRELDRGNNVLKWHPTYNFRPVYFRTFRSPDYRLDQTMEGRGELIVTLSLVAEPFGYGDYVESTGTINNDPEHATNPISFQITGAEGDVPTPLFFHVSNALNQKLLLGVRRHGTPALYFEQAEAMVQGTDTTVQANDPTMSGAGMNWSRTTFATATMQTRLTWTTAPGAGSDDDYRGLYRVFARVGLTVITDDIDVLMRVGSTVTGRFNTPTVRVPQQPNRQMLDLGLLRIPPVPDPIFDGYTGIILPASNTLIDFRAERVAGTGFLDWDYVVLVPADEELMIADFNWVAGDNIVDGPNDIAYWGDLSAVLDYGPVERVGSIPLVSPDQTNLYVAIRGIDQNVIADTMVYTARYWPRYLYIR